MNRPKKITTAVNLLYFSLFIFIVTCILENLHNFQADDAIICLSIIVFYGFIIYQVHVGMKWARMVILLTYIIISLLYIVFISYSLTLHGIGYFFIGKLFMYEFLLSGILILFMMNAVDQLFCQDSTEWFNNISQ